MCACVHVYCCADERIRSCRCHVLAFPLEWRNATPLSYTPRLRSLSTLAAGIRTYVRTYVCSAGTGFDAFQRTHLLFRLLLAGTERELDAIASAASPERSFARGVDSSCFLLVIRRILRCTPISQAAMASGNAARRVSRNLQSISICEDDRALIAKRW